MCEKGFRLPQMRVREENDFPERNMNSLAIYQFTLWFQLFLMEEFPRFYESEKQHTFTVKDDKSGDTKAALPLLFLFPQGL